MPARIVLRNLMEQVARATSLQAVYDSALTGLKDILEVDRAALLMLDEHGVMRFAAWSALSDRFRAEVEDRSPWFPDAATATAAAPILVRDVLQQPDFQPWRPLLQREQIRSLAFIPLRFGSRLLGNVTLYYRQPHEFSVEEITTAEIITHQVAFAVERHRVADELESRLAMEQQSRQAREFLSEASHILAMTHEPVDTARHLAHIVVPRLADWCVIQMVDDDGKIRPIEVAHREPAKVALAWELARRGTPYERGTAIKAIQNGESTLVPCINQSMLKARAKDEKHLFALESLGLNSGITVPLRARGRILGALTILSAESRRIYGTEDLSFVEEIASWAALAIGSAALNRQTEDARAAAERSRERLQALAEIHDALAASLDPDAALRILAQGVVGRLAEYCITYSFDGKTIRRLGVAHRDPDKLQYLETICAAEPPNSDDTWGVGAVIRTGEAIAEPDISEELEARGMRSTAHLDALRELDPGHAIFVPLKARGRTIGAIALFTDSRSGRHYEADDLKLAQELANHAALMIDNVRLYVEARTAIRARDDMIAVVSHDLRNPLQSISSSAAVLQLDPSKDRRLKSAAAISIATEQMDRLLQDLLDITQIDSGQLSVNREMTDVDSLMKEARTLFYPLARERSIRLNCKVAERLPAVYVDRGRILQVLSNLLGNALKFVPAGGRIDLHAAHHVGRVRIAVTDTGTGIDAENLARVFDRFWRADRRKERGAGLGLAVAKGIVQAHGGEIGVESRKGKGSTFYFMLDTGPPIHTETHAAGPASERASALRQPHHGSSRLN